MPEGTEVTVVTQDGTLVRGKIAKVEPERVILTTDRGAAKPANTQIKRTSITEVKRVAPGDVDTPSREARNSEAPAAATRTTAARARTVTIPDGTTLNVELGSALASDTSRVEQDVTGTIDAPVVIDEVTVIPAGSQLRGYVTSAKESGNVKGRAELGFRFTSLTVGPVTYDISTQPIFYRAESNKKDDAVKIGVGAAAGAIVGAITGGKKGAAIGTAVGAGGGTAVVLATDGDEIRLAAGRKLKVSLTDPLIIRSR
ncbi:MAG: hypothetical protein Q7R30_05275 [Acidobacteriota bacterium]|nr:hypothetical protein [Acidobacteriota bacterium]